MRCPRCGNENSEDNRFCGMCGTKLVSPPLATATVPTQTTTLRTSAAPSSAAPSSVAPSSVASTAQPVTQPVPRSAAPRLREDSPGISGPSFLGLNDPAPRPRASLSPDRRSGSGNLDYLLEDDEPRKSGGGKFVLILFALALAVLFGYLRFKVLKERPGKAPASAQDSVPDSSSATPPAVGTAPAAAPAQPAAPAATPPADSSASSAPPAANPAATNDGGGAPAANTPTATAPPTQPAKDSSAPSPTAKEDASADSDASNPATGSAPADTATKAPAKEDADAGDDAPPAPAPKPKKPVAEAPAKPHAGIKPTDSVAEAQKYIYGRGGVTQDCERGMRLLKPAAAEANPKAMVEMGALYSAGLCTPHDLPTAYRWFAMALRKEPDNQSVQADLQKLWGEMTPPERQLAIKLSH